MINHYFILLLFASAIPFGHSAVQPLTTDTIDPLLSGYKVVFVNFYADWCRFSRMLAPIFEEASNLVAKEFPSSGDVLFAKVDCDAQPTIAQKYSVNKYPTMKLFRNGVMMKKEYRGQRTANSLADFVRQQLKNPVKEVTNLDQIYEMEREKRTVIGYFEKKECKEYENFEKTAKILKDDCDFFVAFGDTSKPERTSGDNVIFRPKGEENPEMVYLGSLQNGDLFQAWTQDKCVPLVKEITFANGEELTEEGLPFMILFHKKEDTESLEKYSREVSRLIAFKTSINFLYADCETFSHPLHHLGKTPKDCPLIAIDSFRHMYMFPDFNDVNKPNKLKQFIMDLQSGKLHREFHHGPDTPQAPPALPVAKKADPAADKADKAPSKTPQATDDQTTPPESVFKKLQPSEMRYTMLRDRDEL